MLVVANRRAKAKTKVRAKASLMPRALENLRKEKMVRPLGEPRGKIIGNSDHSQRATIKKAKVHQLEARAKAKQKESGYEKLLDAVSK